jgi:hypothetical protein
MEAGMTHWKRGAALAAGIAVLAAWPALARSHPGTAVVVSQDDPEEELQELLDEYDEALNAYYERYDAAETDEEKGRVYEEAYPQPDGYAEGFLDFAAKYGGTEHAAQALGWVATRCQGEPKTEATEILLHDHLDSEVLGDVAAGMAYDMSDGAAETLRKLISVSPHPTVQAQACFALGLNCKNRARTTADEAAKEKLVAEYVELMSRVTVDFADVADLGGRAEGELFEHENLRIGKVAPDIVAEDLDGVKFKLSDYRGKVVVLDFWGHW